MKFHRILETVDHYYSQKVRNHGPTAQGVDWNSTESQELRFEQLLTVCNETQAISLNDYGCGYGALIEYLTRQGYAFRYCGFDISDDMLATANALYGQQKDQKFTQDASCLQVMDYTIASGIFNVRLKTNHDEWKTYVLHTLDTINELSEKGFAFNMLTKYSDQEHMRPTLYYADPCMIFDHCKTRFSRHVALLHDYGLYEFTMIVRK
ncbi:MAG: putative methyltransferase [Nitrospirales bacterium]|nr:MAG: putative methyltransferase [Nitrospirales bacterium]